MPIDSIRLNFDPNNLWVLNVCLAIMMFGVALELKVEDFKSVLYRPKASFIGLLSQFVLLPALTFLLVLLLQPAPGLALGMMLVAACPGGNISNMMTHLAKGNTALSVSLTAIGTFLAIILTPFNLQFWASLYKPTAMLLREVSLDPFDVLKAIVVLAGVPLAIGMLVNHFFTTLAEKLSRYIKPFSIFIFIGFVVLAFANNYQHFFNYIHLVFLLVLLHNALAISSGFLFSRLFRLPFIDQKPLPLKPAFKIPDLVYFLFLVFLMAWVAWRW